jgi:hypothetical protein
MQEIKWNERSKSKICGRQILNYLLDKNHDNYVPVGAVDTNVDDFIAVVVCVVPQGGRKVFKIKKQKIMGLSVEGTPKENLAWRKVSF